MRPKINIWDNPENISKLVKYRNAGYSAREIAQQLGPEVSRNAVIGKLHRLGLVLCPTKENFNKRVQNAVTFNRRKKRSLGGRRVGYLTRLVKTALPVEGPIPITAVTFAQLEDNHCRFPFGEGSSMMFCGADKEHGSYCAYHHKKSYVEIET